MGSGCYTAMEMSASRDTNLVVSVARRLRVEVDRAAKRLQAAARRRRNAGREFRPIFIAGAIGSGTSLLAASLGQRFAVAGVALESAREIDRRSCLWIDRVQNFDSVRAYAECLEPRSEWSPERAREDLLALYRSKANPSASESSFVDKGPSTNLVRAAFLADLFPDGRFVLIFRDPVANIEGFRRKWTTFKSDPLDESIRFWAAVHERFLEQAVGFPERFVTVEYEALVADYEDVLARLAAVLNIELSAHARPVAARDVGHGRGLRGVEKGRIRVVRDANARSYATLDEADIARIRQVLDPLHGKLRAMAARSGFAAPPRESDA